MTFMIPHHPAVLRMIPNGGGERPQYGKWAGICGELGADLDLTEEFVKMGIDELSVSPLHDPALEKNESESWHSRRDLHFPLHL